MTDQTKPRHSTAAVIISAVVGGVIGSISTLLITGVVFILVYQFL